MIDSVPFEQEKLYLLIIAAISALWTPGPNNILLAHSGARFGFRLTMPHALGVAGGFPIMFAIVALLLGELFKVSSIFQTTIKWTGAALMLWLSWKIATAGRTKPSQAGLRPFRFYEAVAFQWVNPKAWTMALGVTAGFVTTKAYVTEIAVACLVFFILGLTSSTGWTLLGSTLQAWLRSDLRLRAFNGVMGALLGFYAVMIVLG
jgi:threonine/homoserine/homoserine lactone efflux protein